MSDTIKAESTKFGFSLLFLLIILAVGWYIYPKMLERAGKAQAQGFWGAEDDYHHKRLFGDGGS